MRIDDALAENIVLKAEKLRDEQEKAAAQERAKIVEETLRVQKAIEFEEQRIAGQARQAKLLQEAKAKEQERYQMIQEELKRK